MRTTPRPKLFRDPVHDIIDFDTNDPVERVLWSLVCTRTFQRLRRVRQIGFAHLAYHGAEHSRFSHSLGVVHVATKMVDSLELRGLNLSAERRLEVLAAALLHDIGHGPFSHAIEKVTGTHHEHYTARLIQDPSTDVHQILSGVSSALPERVAAYFTGQVEPKWLVLKDVVSSQLDADRLDYILRDSMATGVKIGVYDFERILSMLEVCDSPQQDGARRLAVSYRAREAVEGYLIARFHMYKQVYLHKVARSAEKMLEAIFERASELVRDGYTFAMDVPAGMQAILAQREVELEDFLDMDDADVWFMLKLWRRDPDPVLSRLAHGLLNRDLYKTVDLDRNDPVLVARVFDRANAIAQDMGLNPTYAVLADRAQNTPYKPYKTRTHSGFDESITIINKDGSIGPIDDQSDLIHLLGSDSYKMWRLCVPPELRERLLKTS